MPESMPMTLVTVAPHLRGFFFCPWCLRHANFQCEMMLDPRFSEFEAVFAL